MEHYAAPTALKAVPPEADIPQEITDMILDLLSQDSNSLKSCSLVSRQWRPRSQYHLHSTLKIDRRSNLPLLSDIYTDTCLASYVRCLNVETMWWPFWESILPVLEKCESVRSLSLVSVGDVNEKMHGFLATRYASLSSFSISFVTFENFGAFSDLVNALPNLTHFSLRNIYWTKADDDEPMTVASVHRFRSLDIAYCTEQNVLVDWLMGAGDNLQLESLALTWYEQSDSVRDFMHFLGPHLQRLKFSYVFSDAQSSDWRDHPLDLSSNTGLRMLEFGTCIMAPYVWGGLPTIPEMLASVSSTVLTTLGIYLDNLDEEPVPSSCLSTIDGILCRSQFKSLSEVNLLADMNGARESVREECLAKVRGVVHTAMPKTLEKEILRIRPPEK